MNRRNFAKAVAGLSGTLLALPNVGLASDPQDRDGEAVESERRARGFPAGRYTPFGYIDNPYQAWNLHPSGVFRSVPPIGMGLYYPAGPGGYFDYEKNSVYRVLFRLGFRIGGQRYFTESDFARPGIELVAPHHSKNLLTFAFSAGPMDVACPFFQIGENGLACFVHLQSRSAQAEEVEVFAVERLVLGNARWWGRNGVTGSYEADKDQILLRSWAAGPVFSLASSLPSTGRMVASGEEEVDAWVSGEGRPESDANSHSYFPKSLCGGLSYRVEVPGEGLVKHGFVVARGANERFASDESHSSRLHVTGTYEDKKAADDVFWDRAPRLEGDFPEAWKNAWVYDFETLRMMVRRPIGCYQHNWDAMQIQAPRNVLAETSIDMWTLSYANAEDAKRVLVGQFQDALEPNVPCMREDGTMNMVATDGSECGTAIQWCYPFYCLESVYLRSLDRAWLEVLYPHLVRYMEWMLKHRSDSNGWIIAKCSWETGMDSSRRFLIQQPTGGESIDFIHISELQAAMSHAARLMTHFAETLGRTADLQRWQGVAATYAKKTRELWYQGWFYDVDTRTGRHIMIPGYRPITQVGPIMCGVATPGQTREMIPKMREYATQQQFWLEWASQVFPYAESMWLAGQRKLLSEPLHAVISRVYASMDRRKVEPEKKLGWPGVSCEMWGPEGAVGGEGYGWGSTLPSHIIRSLFGFRESLWPVKPWFTLGPNLPDEILAQGKTFFLRNVRYRQMAFDIGYEHKGSGQLRVRLSSVEGRWPASARVVNEKGQGVGTSRSGADLEFDAENHSLYRVEL